MIKFDIPFNEQITRNQIELSFRLMYSKSYKNIKKSIIVGLALLVLGILSGIGEESFINPFTIFSAIWIVGALILIIPFLLIHRKVKKNSISVIEEAKEKKLTATYEFSEDHISYTNGLASSEVKWLGVKGYTVVKDNVFIMLSKSILNSHIIGKSEISESNFNSLLELLEEKSTLIEYKI